ncbi:glutathione s-transferase, putative [Ricinus communis]|uniref:glutathione transferase n=1 Tax=Ricinus communis TaxID=3988 RepID=B9S3A4_RICCO|nr:glutathione s-transferase, putative [Ricinus communis]|eukprot:XP_002520473.3 glutathione S-transferase U7 [Ricinus communis]
MAPTTQSEMNKGNELWKFKSDPKMAEEVQLIGMWASPFNCRAQLALKLKGVQYEYIEEDLSNKSPLLLKYNPVYKKIPVLVHKGKPISESLVILEYIEETWKNNPIMPQDSYSTAIARFWANFADENILQTAIKSSKAKGEEREKLWDEVCQNLKLLENELNGKQFFGGKNIGYLDIVAFSLVHWFQVANEVTQMELITEENFPGLLKWTEKMGDIDVVKETLPPRDKHLALIRDLMEAQKI